MENCLATVEGKIDIIKEKGFSAAWVAAIAPVPGYKAVVAYPGIAATASRFPVRFSKKLP